MMGIFSQIYLFFTQLNKEKFKMSGSNKIKNGKPMTARVRIAGINKNSYKIYLGH